MKRFTLIIALLIALSPAAKAEDGNQQLFMARDFIIEDDRSPKLKFSERHPLMVQRGKTFINVVLPVASAALDITMLVLYFI